MNTVVLIPQRLPDHIVMANVLSVAATDLEAIFDNELQLPLALESQLKIIGSLLTQNIDQTEVVTLLAITSTALGSAEKALSNKRREIAQYVVDVCDLTNNPAQLSEAVDPLEDLFGRALHPLAAVQLAIGEVIKRIYLGQCSQETGEQIANLSQQLSNAAIALDAEHNTIAERLRQFAKN